jgi:uncharacterized protein (DUF433 family)
VKAQSRPFSLRLSPGLDARITALAKRTKRSRAAVLESLADEAERTRRYPGIGFRGPDAERDAWVIGTPFDVWQIIEALQENGGDAERMARESDLSSGQIRLALAYYDEFGQEIDDSIALNRRPLGDLRREFPFLEVVEVPG